MGGHSKQKLTEQSSVKKPRAKDRREKWQMIKAAALRQSKSLPHEEPSPESQHASQKRERIDLSIREIRQLFESFKGIRISNRLAYQIQEALIKGEGEQVGPVINVGSIKVHFAINGLPSLTALRRVLLYRALLKSKNKDGMINLERAAHFIRLDPKGALSPVQLLKRRLLHVGITLSSCQKDLRVKGGLSFEEISFDFEAPEDGLDLAEFGRKLLISIYEYHDCSVSATAQFFHTHDQLMLGMLKRAGVEFKTPEAIKHFQLPPELEKQFGPAIQKQLCERLKEPMIEILRTTSSRAKKKKLANRRFLDEMEDHIKNYIQLVMVPEFGASVLNEENAFALHAAAWHFLQWEIGQLPVEDIINLEVVSPYEMMSSRILRKLKLTKNGCPVFFCKDYSTKVTKSYAPIIITEETLLLIFRTFKTADLLESSFHAAIVEEAHPEQDHQRALLEIELKHLQKNSLEILENDIKNRLLRTYGLIQNPGEFHGILSVEIKQVLSAYQDMVEAPHIHFFGIPKNKYGYILDEINVAIDQMQIFLREASTIRRSIDSIINAYLNCLKVHDKLCKSYLEETNEGRAMINTWASLHELYRIMFAVKGLDPPKSRRKKKKRAPVASKTSEHLATPMLYFGPKLNEIPAEILIRATFIFPTDSFQKLNLIPPHLRTFFIIDEPDNHVGQYHMAAWAFRIHWKRRRLGLGQKQVADDYIRSLRFLRCFAYKKDRKSKPHLFFCNCDSEFFGQAKLADGKTLLETAREIALKSFEINEPQIHELTQAEEPANENEKYHLFDQLIAKKK